MDHDYGPSCHPSISVNALKGTQSIDLTNGLVNPANPGLPQKRPQKGDLMFLHFFKNKNLGDK